MDLPADDPSIPGVVAVGDDPATPRNEQHDGFVTVLKFNAAGPSIPPVLVWYDSTVSAKGSAEVK